MKLRNLAYAAMIAVAFTACSNENDPAPTPEPTGGDGSTYLSVGVEKPVATKAIADGDLNDFVVLVFDANDKLEYVDYKNSGLESNCIKLASGAKKVLILGNTVVVGGTTDAPTYTINNILNAAGTANENKVLTIGTTTLAEVTAYKYAPAGMQKVGDLGFALMLSSQVYAVTLAEDTHNLLGFGTGDEPSVGHTTGLPYVRLLNNMTPAKLYRNVAKINLTGITFDDSRFPESSLKITGIYALNGNKQTRIADASPWGSLEVTSGGFFGLTNANFIAWSGSRSAYIADYASYDGAAKYVQDATYEYYLNTTGMAPTAYPIEAKGVFSFYAFENNGLVGSGTSNANNYTLLVIKGDFSYTHIYYKEDGITIDTSKGDNGKDAITLEDQYYVIPVGSTAHKADFSQVTENLFPKRGGAAYEGVMRNLEYNLSVKISGRGSSEEDEGGTINPPPTQDAWLDVKMEVVPYGTVTQNVGF